jgi:hypothetical protein
MKSFLIGLAVSPVLFAAVVLFWWVVFDGIDRHMAEEERFYQECGVHYGSPTEVD